MGQNKGSGRQKNFKDNASSNGKKPQKLVGETKKNLYIFYINRIFFRISFENKLPGLIRRALLPLMLGRAVSTCW